MAQVQRQGNEGAADDLERIGEGLANVFRAGHTGRFHARLAQTAGVDLDRTGFVMLGKVAHAGSIRVSDLAEQMGLDISTVSRKAQQLEAAGLVERTETPGDRRGRLVRLTTLGEQTAVRASRVHAENIKRHFLGPLPAADRERFMEDLRILSHTARDTLPRLP